MAKPDAVSRGLVGEVIRRVERKGLKIVAMKMMRIDRDLAEQHYGEHREKPFFGDLVSFITSNPVVAMVIEGKDAVRVVRSLLGETDPNRSPMGTLRGDFGLDLGRNIVHGSDSPESAEREINLFFRPEEILDYERADEGWVYE
ncbi:MAG: nucleoside-diphosphate kinase [Euryarchaeota archaeon]|nr:nucleoside-diphosphate kinase [Euryarchaeota archaeon]